MEIGVEPGSKLHKSTDSSVLRLVRFYDGKNSVVGNRLQQLGFKA